MENKNYHITFKTEKCVYCLGKPAFHGGHVLSDVSVTGGNTYPSQTNLRIISGVCHECDAKPENKVSQVSHEVGYRKQWSPEMGIKFSESYEVFRVK